MSAYWDQRNFDKAIQAQLGHLRGPKLARAINKKAFYVALAAYSETPKKEAFDISTAVAYMVRATRQDGSTGLVPLLWILAAKRVGKNWPAQRMVLGEGRKTRLSVIGGYRRALAKKSDTILGMRKRARGFLRVGWVNVMKQLGPMIGQNRGYPPGMDRRFGVAKGVAKPAQPGGYRTVCTIINSGQAKSDRRSGLLRIGGPALDRAFARETAQILEYLEEEALKEMEREFNVSQK